MRARSFVALAMAAAGLAAGACVIDIPDVVGDGGADAASDVATDSADGDSVFEAGPCDACGAPAGFSPVLFTLDRSTPCPTGTSDTDLVADPGDAGAGACTCGCSVSSQPSCLPASLLSFYNGNGQQTCTVSGVTVQIPDGGGCVTMTGNISADIQFDPFVPAGGTCSDVPASDPSKVATSAARICTAPCGSVTCAAASGFRPCYASSGDVACPNGLEKHTVGAAPAVVCSCGACSMSVDGGCEGTVTLFKNPDCTNPVESVPVDGTCTANQAPGSQVQSVSYAPTLVGLGCKGGTPSVTSVGLTQPVTVCCPP